MDIIKSFMAELEKVNKFHSLYVSRQLKELNTYEEKSFNNLLNYFIFKGYDIPFLVSSYNMMVNDSVLHQRYFIANNDYMFHSFDEVNAAIYNNPKKMQEYLTGLSISHYLWHNHLTLNRYFIEKFKEFINSKSFEYKHYLEVGPGYGENFLYALYNSDFLFYEGIDVSETAVKNSLDFIEYNLTNTNELRHEVSYKIIQQDFFEYDTNKKVDAFVCSEVLEHIENPLLFLSKISDIVHSDSFIYITTAINAPSSGHIYLFRHIDDVIKLVNDAGLYVEDYICSGNSNRENVAEQNNRPILTAMILRKK